MDEDQVNPITAIAAGDIIVELARQAGKADGQRVTGVHEEFLEAISEEGFYGVEVWTVFELVDLEGQVSFAHLPGDLDSLIVRTVRDHARVLQEELGR